mgnify:CR=1 FL=1
MVQKRLQLLRKNNLKILSFASFLFSILNPLIIILYARIITAIKIGTPAMYVITLYHCIILFHCSLEKGDKSFVVLPNINSSYCLNPTPNVSLVVKSKIPSAIPPYHLSYNFFK